MKVQYRLMYDGGCNLFNFTIPSDIQGLLRDGNSTMDVIMQTREKTAIIALEDARQYVQIVPVDANGTACDGALLTTFYRYMNPEGSCNTTLQLNQTVEDKIVMDIPRGNESGGDYYFSWRKSPSEDRDCFCRVNHGSFEGCAKDCNTEYNITTTPSSRSVIFYNFNFSSNPNDFIANFIYKENPCRPYNYVCASYSIMKTYVLTHSSATCNALSYFMALLVMLTCFYVTDIF